MLTSGKFPFNQAESWKASRIWPKGARQGSRAFAAAQGRDVCKPPRRLKHEGTGEAGADFGERFFGYFLVATRKYLAFGGETPIKISVVTQ